jgi:cysteinyl-tRNA synthetase
MTLKLHNSLTRKLEEFIPIDPSSIKVYRCGNTLYSAPHLGNARPAIVFDILFRVLRQIYGETQLIYAVNYTDIDDKIINKSLETGQTIEEITASAQDKYLNDMRALNVLEPTLTPYASRHVDTIIDMVDRLLKLDAAYQTKNGIYFRSNKFDSSKGLAHHNHSDLDHGNRVDPDDLKENQADFALWKFTDGIGTFESPWGRGRLGWHTECSAMIEHHLGETIDIHTGGSDLRFPHHEAEIAQSTTLHDGKPLANYWLHNGLVTVNGKKMSKSLDNFIEVSDILTDFPGEVIRYLMVSNHYRSPLDWTQQRLHEAKESLTRLYRSLIGFNKNTGLTTLEIMQHLEDDLNTPSALAFLHNLANRINSESDPEQKQKLQNLLYTNGEFLGLFNSKAEQWFAVDVNMDDAIMQMIKQRNNARINKEWTIADQIRIELNSMGVFLEDTPTETKWRKL